MRGIFAIDGGNATGLAWGVFDEQAKSLAAAIDPEETGSYTINRYTKRKGEARVYPDGLLSDQEQGAEIIARFMKFKSDCVHGRGLQPGQVDLIIEDFILLPGQHAGGRDGVASVRIAWLVAGWQLGMATEYARRHKKLHVSHPIWQTPSVMGKVKDDQLKRLGLWIPGRDHERAAMKHIVARLDKLIK